MMKFLIGLILGIIIGAVTYRFNPIKTEINQQCPSLKCPPCNYEEHSKVVMESLFICQGLVSKYIEKIEKQQESSLIMATEILNLKDSLDNCRVTQQIQFCD